MCVCTYTYMLCVYVCVFMHSCILCVCARHCSKHFKNLYHLMLAHKFFMLPHFSVMVHVINPLQKCVLGWSACRLPYNQLVFIKHVIFCKNIFSRGVMPNILSVYVVAARNFTCCVYVCLQWLSYLSTWHPCMPCHSNPFCIFKDKPV
jgi:hypothetical protein